MNQQVGQAPDALTLLIFSDSLSNPDYIAIKNYIQCDLYHRYPRRAVLVTIVFPGSTLEAKLDEIANISKYNSDHNLPAFDWFLPLISFPPQLPGALDNGIIQSDLRNVQKLVLAAGNITNHTLLTTIPRYDAQNPASITPLNNEIARQSTSDGTGGHLVNLHGIMSSLVPPRHPETWSIICAWIGDYIAKQERGWDRTQVVALRYLSRQTKDIVPNTSNLLNLSSDVSTIKPAEHELGTYKAPDHTQQPLAGYKQELDFRCAQHMQRIGRAKSTSPYKNPGLRIVRPERVAAETYFSPTKAKGPTKRRHADASEVESEDHGAIARASGGLPPQALNNPRPLVSAKGKNASTAAINSSHSVFQKSYTIDRPNNKKKKRGKLMTLRYTPRPRALAPQPSGSHIGSARCQNVGAPNLPIVEEFYYKSIFDPDYGRPVAAYHPRDFQKEGTVDPGVLGKMAALEVSQYELLAIDNWNHLYPGSIDDVAAYADEQQLQMSLEDVAALAYEQPLPGPFDDDAAYAHGQPLPAPGMQLNDGDARMMRDWIPVRLNFSTGKLDGGGYQVAAHAGASSSSMLNTPQPQGANFAEPNAGISPSPSPITPAFLAGVTTDILGAHNLPQPKILSPHAAAVSEETRNYWYNDIQRHVKADKCSFCGYPKDHELCTHTITNRDGPRELEMLRRTRERMAGGGGKER